MLAALTAGNFKSNRVWLEGGFIASEQVSLAINLLLWAEAWQSWELTLRRESGEEEKKKSLAPYERGVQIRNTPCRSNF